LEHPSPSSFFSHNLKLQIATRFENYVFQLLKKEFRDCAIIEKARLESGVIPDFVVECDKKLIVIDAKAKERLTKADIDQMIGYLQELDGDSAIIYVASFTEVSQSVEDYATLNVVDIEYTEWIFSSSSFLTMTVWAQSLVIFTDKLLTN